jgi:hypothetical protein
MAVIDQSARCPTHAQMRDVPDLIENLEVNQSVRQAMEMIRK